MGSERGGSLICSLHISIIMLRRLNVQSAASPLYIHCVAAIIPYPAVPGKESSLCSSHLLQIPFWMIKNKCCYAVYELIISQFYFCVSKLHSWQKQGNHRELKCWGYMLTLCCIAFTLLKQPSPYLTSTFPLSQCMITPTARTVLSAPSSHMLSFQQLWAPRREVMVYAVDKADTDRVAWPRVMRGSVLVCVSTSAVRDGEIWMIMLLGTRWWVRCWWFGVAWFSLKGFYTVPGNVSVGLHIIA